MFALLLFAATASQFASSASAQDAPTLSAAEIAAIDRQIATLHTQADRHFAQTWTSPKKVAEFLCRPSATPALLKQVKGVDRVFLGTDDPKTLTLESNQRLTGTGSARYPQGWQDFTFTCELDPATGKVTAFTPVLTPAAH